MADASLTTPGAVSRRFLLSAAVAAPIATVTAGFSPGGTLGLQQLLDRYRETGIRLREIEIARAGALQLIPTGLRPGQCSTNSVSRWPQWSRSELDALGVPASFPLRPSQADFDQFYQEAVRLDPENRETLKRLHKSRIGAWLVRRNHQKDWYRQTGIDAINRQHSRLVADKHRIERELMDLMIGPGKAAIDA
jgi:hypothetical protein